MRDNRSTRPLALGLAATLLLAACGGGSSAGDPTQSTRAKTPTASGAKGDSPASKQKHAPKRAPLHKASPRIVKVITAWADMLRAGHIRQAASYFDLPVIVQNGGPAVRLTTRKEVLAFNRTLPCGAHVVRTVAGSTYTVATFVLTERPGSPGCGATGKLAATAFLLHHGKISQWIRVLVPPPLGDAENVEPGPEA